MDSGFKTGLLIIVVALGTALMVAAVASIDFVADRVSRGRGRR